MKWITATDLDLWAKRLEAQGTLPELLRFLSFATLSKPTTIHFRAGEGIQVVGPDGCIETDYGNAFVPDGKSFWEASVDKEIKKKANKDYRTRTEDKTIRKKRETSFVFATLRRFPNKQKWCYEKEAQKKWKTVGVIDGDDIEAWIDQAPAVGAWLARRICKYRTGVLPLTDFWESWKGSTEPALDSKINLESRDDAVQAIRQWIGGEPTSLPIRAESVDDAAAFLASFAEEAKEDEKYRIHSRALIIEDEESWRSLIPLRDSLILIPRFSPSSSTQLRNLPHYVLLPLTGVRTEGAGSLTLPPIRDYQMAENLTRIGISEERAKHLASESGGRFSILRRLMSNTAQTPPPIWAKPAEAPFLTPFALVGQWDETNAADCRVLEAIAGKEYVELQRTLSRWVNEPDSPVRKRGNFWEILSREDVWKQLQSYISNSQLREFLMQMDIVLGEIDPRYELSPEERYLALIKKKVTTHSPSLRGGMATTLALMGAFGIPGPAYNDALPQDWVDGAVRKLLSRSTEKFFLPSISQFLPDIAEASPSEFLAAVERDLRLTPSPLLEMFQDEGMLGGSAHTGLLWALEIFPWKPQYLTRVSLILAALHRIDPGGGLANRPLNTLGEIFLSWLPHTTAPLETRLDALHEITEREPDVAWELLMGLIQTGSTVSHNIFLPQWRDWAFDWKRGVKPTERFKALDKMNAEALLLAGRDPNRWITLVSKFDDLLPKHFDEAITKLRSVVEGPLPEKDKLKIKDALRSLVHKHRMHSDARWALPARVVRQIQEIYDSIIIEKWQDHYTWLFAHSVDLPDVYTADWKVNEELIEKHRLEATLEIVNHDKTEIIDFAISVQNSYSLGKSIGFSNIAQEEYESLLEISLKDERPSLTAFAHGLMVGPSTTKGESWAREMLLPGLGLKWSMEMKAHFLLGLPLTPFTWDLASECGEEVEAKYWKSTMVWPMPNKSDTTRAANNLLRVGRPLAALNVVYSYLSQGKKDLEVELLYRIASDVCKVSSADPEMSRVDLLGYHLNPILNIIEDSHQYPPDEIAQIEWQLFPLLEHHRTRPFVLQRYISDSPKFFVELLSIIYLREGEKRREPPDPIVVARARLGSDLLDSWKILPGLRDDNTIDQNKLTNWVNEVRSLSQKEGRLSIAEMHIARALVDSPPDADGLWRDVAVRNVIEMLSNEDFDSSMVAAIRNSRGVVTKSPLEGGLQERELSRHYRQMADSLTTKWPKTAAILYRVADSYDSQALFEDNQHF